VSTRTWFILGGVVVGILGLVTWAGIAVLAWAFGQIPVATDAGKRLAGEAMTQFEHVAPGLRQEIGQWLPGLAEGLPLTDVSGVDVGPVARFPGLVRSHFAREETTVEVRYSGPAAFETVRDHYLRGFAAAGYTSEVKQATADAEHHVVTRDQETIGLALLRPAAGRVEVRLSTPPPE